jgi:hypothetical protein
MAIPLPPLPSPRAAWADLRAFLATRERYHWVFAAISLAIPGFFIFEFWLVSGKSAAYRPPEVTYVKQWPKTRTDAEIKTQQAKDAPAEEAERKQQAADDAAYRKKRAALKKLLNP